MTKTLNKLGSAPRIGQVWANWLIGGRDPTINRGVDPEVNKIGWSLYLERLAKDTIRFGAMGSILRMVCGIEPSPSPEGFEPGAMRLDGWLRMYPDQKDYESRTKEFIAGSTAYQKITGHKPWVYLGQVDYCEDLKKLTVNQLGLLIRQAVEPFKKCGVVIDSAGTSGTPITKEAFAGVGVNVANILTQMNIPVGYEPIPVRWSQWSSANYRGFTQSSYVKQLDAGISEYCSWMDTLDNIEAKQTIFVEENPEPDLAWVRSWLSRGVDVAVACKDGVWNELDAAAIRGPVNLKK